MRGKPANPAKRMGVFKRLSEVPTRYRLSTYAVSYEGRDVWKEYMTDRDGTFSSENIRYRTNRAGRRWQEYMEDSSRHYALPLPEDVEGYCAYLLTERVSLTTAYQEYWEYLERFFNWLLYHKDHPHVYNPLLMAVIEYPDGEAGRVWDEMLRYTTTADGRAEWREPLQRTMSQYDERKVQGVPANE